MYVKVGSYAEEVPQLVDLNVEADLADDQLDASFEGLPILRVELE